MRIGTNPNNKSLSAETTVFTEEGTITKVAILDFDSDFIEEDLDSVHSSFTLTDNANEYIIEISMHGFEEDDITIEIENDIINVVAKTETGQNQKSNWLGGKEVIYNSYSRSFKLPENLNHGQILAVYKKGILIITIQKEKRIRVESIQ